ncbi:hypothetical protein [Clostridium sp.]|uniref:hypothetical protein n=1 Tax=Clostridium sp. TaxID=1506 RepID=UPI003D6C9A2B
MKYCEKCKSVLKEPYRFCSVCGCKQDFNINEKLSSGININNRVVDNNRNIEQTVIREDNIKSTSTNSDKERTFNDFNKSANKDRLIIGETCEIL